MWLNFYSQRRLNLKQLCLNSGEIIKMSPEMTMMFEVSQRTHRVVVFALDVRSCRTTQYCSLHCFFPSRLKTTVEKHTKDTALLLQMIFVGPCTRLHPEAIFTKTSTFCLFPTGQELYHHCCHK